MCPLILWSFSPFLHYPWQPILELASCCIILAKALTDTWTLWDSRDSRSTRHMLGNTKTFILKMSSYFSILEPEIREKLSFQRYFISEDPSTSHPSQGLFSAVLQGGTASITSLCQATLDGISIFKNISAKYSSRQQGYTGRDFVIWGPKKSCF